MAFPTWFWPPNGASARGLSLVPLGTGFAVPDWIAPIIWPYSPSANKFTTGIILATRGQGIAAMCPDVAAGALAVSWDGIVYRILAAGSVTATSILPSGSVYTGAALVATTPYFLSSQGRVYTSGSSLLGNFNTTSWFLQTSGTTLTTLLPTSGIGMMNSNTGVTGRIALPVTGMTATCMALSGSTTGVGGWRQAAPLAGGTAAALDPQDSTTMVVVNSGTVTLWRTAALYNEIWTPGQTLNSLANPLSLSWTPNGTQILLPSPSSGVVHVVNYIAGVMSFAQNVAVASATSVAIAGDSVHALVAQSGAAQLTSLVSSSGVWATGTPIPLLAPVRAVAPIGSGQAVATVSSGLAFLTLSTGAWVVTSQIGLSFTPSLVTTDPYGIAYAAGNGQIAVASSGGLIGYGAWPGGTPTSIAVNQGRIILAVPSDGALYIFGQTSIASPIGNSFTQQSSTSLSLGAFVGLGLSADQLFVLGSGSTLQFGFSGLPYVLTPVMSGVAGQWNGSSWITTQLGIGQVPSALGFDSSNNLSVATIQNNLWNISPSGTVRSSGFVTPYSGQTSTTWFGLSSLQAFSGHLYGATSMPGALVQLS